MASQAVLVVKNLPAHAGDIRDMGLIHGLGRSTRGGNGNPLQNSCLKNPTDRGARWATVHIVQLLSRVQLFVTPPDCRTPGSSVLHHRLELAQTHVH